MTRPTIGESIDHVVGRVTAGVVDWLLRGILAAPFVISPLGRFADGEQTGADIVAVQLVFGVVFVAMGAMQGRLGWTPGRWLVRHRVVAQDRTDDEPTPPGVRTGIVRTVPSLIALLFLWAGPISIVLAVANLAYIVWDPENRSVHDRTANTLVVTVRR